MTKPLKRDAQAPIPTPADIEHVLAGMRDGDDPFLRWCQLDYEAEHEGVDPTHRRADALSDTLWWVDAVDPTNMTGRYWGAGMTPAKAAAAAWVNVCLGELFWTYSLVEVDHCSLSDEDLSSVPRQVEAGWSFDLFAVPRATVDGHKIQ